VDDSETKWEENAVKVLQGLVQWWESDDPDRRLSHAGAHNMANLVMMARWALAVREADGDKEKLAELLGGP
jgi:hypothetical protein